MTFTLKLEISATLKYTIEMNQSKFLSPKTPWLWSNRKLNTLKSLFVWSWHRICSYTLLMRYAILTSINFVNLTNTCSKSVSEICTINCQDMSKKSIISKHMSSMTKISEPKCRLNSDTCFSISIKISLKSRLHKSLDCSATDK